MRLALADPVAGRMCTSSTLRASVVVVALFIFGTLLPATAAAAVQRAAFRIDPPVAHAGHDLSAHVGDAVTLDGSNSHDPAADAGVLERALITYRWSIANAPPGSTASIDTTSPAPVLVPDVPGAYVLQLAVVASDGSVSAPAEVTVNASLHIHLDEHNCLEVIVIRGRADKVHEIASKLIATKGVQNGKLVTTTPEMKQ